MSAPDTQAQGDTRTLAQQIRELAAELRDHPNQYRAAQVSLLLDELADDAAETELRADRAENARDQVGRMLHAAQAERGRLRNALAVIQMIVEESATNDADLLRQAILEQLPPATDPRHAPGDAESDAAGRTAALVGTSAREPAAGAQGAADGLPCGHCGLPVPDGPRGEVAGIALHHTGSNPPQADPIDCYRLVTVYREPIGSRMAKPAPPACPDCGMPETNCCCG